MTTPLAGRNCLALAALPSAVRHARDYVAQKLRLNGHADLVCAATIVASELVTNAIKTVGTFETEACGAWVQIIGVCCYLDGGCAVIEVWDGDPRPPVRRQPAADDEGGRGLLLVDALAAGWGYHRPKAGGKVVWCALK